MKTHLTCHHRWFALGIIVAGLVLSTLAPAHGGESILFSREKPKAAPEKGSLVPREGLDGRNRLGPITPFDIDLPNQPQSRSRNAQKDRKQKAAELEKKNWMVYSPGELQEREEENTAFGIRDLELEKDDGTGEGFFAPKDDDKGRPRPPSQSNRPAAPNSKQSGEDASKNPGDDNSSKQESQKQKDAKLTDSSLKSLLPKGNDTRLNLGSAKAGTAPGGEAGDSSGLRSLLSGSANDRTVGQPVRPQTDADVRFSPGSITALKPSGLDSLASGNSWRTDASSKPGAPAFTPPTTRRADDFGGTLNNTAGRGPVGSSTIPSSSDQNFGRNLNPYNINAPSLNNPAYQRPTPGGTFGVPSPFPQQQQPSALQRTTRETFTIPSR